jgi:hypothetical protein
MGGAREENPGQINSRILMPLQVQPGVGTEVLHCHYLMISAS